jgi:hypothetical protein
MPLPGITVSETLNFVKNVENEGRTILVIGNTGYTANTDKLYTFKSKADATQQLKPKTDSKVSEGASDNSDGSSTTSRNTATKNEEAYNTFIQFIEDIFGEADVNHAIHGIGLNKVYAVNIGANATNKKILEAWATAEKETDVDIEVYPGLTDIELINVVKGHLDEIQQHGDYRIAIATVKADTVDKMIASVKKDNKSAIDSSRIVLHVDPNMVGFLAAKIACTPYYQDPARTPYYTVTSKEIKQFTREDLVKLLDAGLVADQIINKGGVRMVELPYIRSTRYTDDKSAADSYLHQRLNADQHASVTDRIARRYIKSNNTDAARHSIECECCAYLNREMENERLMNYSYNVHPKPDDPYTLIIDMMIRPPKSIHFIEIKRVVEI